MMSGVKIASETKTGQAINTVKFLKQHSKGLNQHITYISRRLHKLYMLHQKSSTPRMQFSW
uniref:Uncharacterized protein n=1 Tax=Arundo donax TaxID=35708 RepID=A0A0A9EGC7_ARUDO